jgi:hypothetical protein
VSEPSAVHQPQVVGHEGIDLFIGQPLEGRRDRGLERLGAPLDQPAGLFVGQGYGLGEPVEKLSAGESVLFGGPQRRSLGSDRLLKRLLFEPGQDPGADLPRGNRLPGRGFGQGVGGLRGRGRHAGARQHAQGRQHPSCRGRLHWFFPISKSRVTW